MRKRLVGQHAIDRSTRTIKTSKSQNELAIAQKRLYHAISSASTRACNSWTTFAMIGPSMILDLIHL
jgi:hypothetical protein